MDLNRHRRYTVAVPRHPFMPSPTARDIALSGFFADIRLGSNTGPPPDQLDLRSRMRWHPPAAGRRIVSFADGLLILGKHAAKALPTAPEMRPPRLQTAAGIASKIASPLLPATELVRGLADLAADVTIDALGERYERAHPERVEAWIQSKADWQSAFAEHVQAQPDVHVIPRVDIVDVSIVPFMVFGFGIRSISDSGEHSAYTLAANAPARRALAKAGVWFRTRLERELAWLSDHGDVTEGGHSGLIRGLEELLPSYARVPQCAALLDERLPGWRAGI